eukprot:GHVS01043115.1.p1 GENE.GHVS01043115.1~~GHVS01043115.1.p1  ORF type:complete len:328 (-),score=49.29 GHVS01043115.1:48-1031(-)
MIGFTRELQALREFGDGCGVKKKDESSGGEVEGEYRVEDFMVEREPLGRGRTGLVYAALHLDTDEAVALKVMIKSTITSQGFLDQIVREALIQRQLTHPNIVGFRGEFQDKKKIFYVLEFANGGNLRGRMRQLLGQLSEKEAGHFVYQIAQAIKYMHSKGVIHRDIKPDNILIHRTKITPYSTAYSSSAQDFGVAKLGDLGWACDLKAQGRGRMTLCGTPDYLPPEMLTQQPYDFGVDMWCMGVTLYEMLTGVPPFIAPDRSGLFKQIREVNFSFPAHPIISEQAKSLIRRLCSKDPAKRPTADELISDPWIDQYRRINNSSVAYSL